MRRHDAKILTLIPTMRQKELRFIVYPNHKIMSTQRDEAEKHSMTSSTRSVQRILERSVNPEEMQTHKPFNQTKNCVAFLREIVDSVNFECQSLSMKSISNKFGHFVL
jgi:hypothetical protein